MKQVIVGVYYFGHDQAQLVLREGTGGECYVTPEKGSIARIKVGADEKQWSGMVAVLLHEVTELASAKMGLRWHPSDNIGNDNGEFLFAMTHPQFSELSARAADYLAESLPDLSAAWKKWHKPLSASGRGRGGVRRGGRRPARRKK
jgi:hypothetical protein